MLLIIVLAIAVIVFFVLGHIAERSYLDGIELVMFLAGFISLVALIICGGITIHNTSYHDVCTEQMRMEYESYVYQLENNFYNKITYDGRAELMKNILDYNKSVLIGREKHNSAWIGSMYQEDYDSLPLIEIEKYIN